jgi:hypothetical protein
MSIALVIVSLSAFAALVGCVLDRAAAERRRRGALQRSLDRLWRDDRLWP